MTNKYFKKELKIKIVNRYLDGESIKNLTRELWPNHPINNRRKNIYNRIYQYGDNQKYLKKRIKTTKT